MKNFNTNSNYWIGNLTGSLDDAWWREDETKKKGKDLVALAGYRKAIANFVNIVTGRQDIPVVYNSKDESYTDGKKVVLSGRMNDKTFDPSVGLALHEGSHIVHTDFDIIKSGELNERVEKVIFDKQMNTFEERRELMKTIGRVKDLLNYVEDRRIDYIVFKSAPGYKNYYHSMYKKYFEFKVINKALKSSEYRDPSQYQSYEFRIINFLNENTDLDALPGLRDIYHTINFKNISRLKNTSDSLDIAIKIYQLIKPNLVEMEIPNPDQNQSDENKSAQDGDDSVSESSTSNNASSSEDPTDAPSEQSKSSKFPELSDKDKKSLDKAFNNQRDFNNNNVKKSNLTKNDKATLKSVEDSQAHTKEVGFKEKHFGTTNCIVIPRLKKSMIPTGWRDRVYNFLNIHPDHHTETAISEGIILGKRLGKKLQIRNEERSTKWTRQDSGRIDKRLIAELGFDNSNVFSQTNIEKYDDAYIHISLDASGSMSGTNWNNALKTAAAISQASSMTTNIHVQVTLRTTQETGKDYLPIICTIYDSKINKMIHIKNTWKYLTTCGTTPEGLCFQAIKDQIIKSANGKDSYFLNLSDGQPWFANKYIRYSHRAAFTHTRKQVEDFKKIGIKVLSFFISNWKEDMTDFKRMYGKDSVSIDPTSLVSLAKVLNKKFLEN